MKICTECEVEKSLQEFSKWRCVCKKCRNAYRVALRNSTEERKANSKAVLRKSYRKHRTKRLLEVKVWALANPEKVKGYSKKGMAIYRKKYPERRKETYRKHHIKTLGSISGTIRSAFDNQNLKKGTKTAILLGAQIGDVRAQIEKLFWPGMSWTNRHKWHLDHIRPCADFDLTDLEQQKLCFHFNNLQPLWADDNGIKSDRLDWTPHESRHSLPERLKPAPFIFS